MRYLLLFVLVVFSLPLLSQERGAGAPSYVPGLLANYFYIDTTNDSLYFYDGDEWLTVGFPNSGGDNLGNHTLEENLITGSFYISSDGDSEGILIESDGDITFENQSSQEYARWEFDETNGHVEGVIGLLAGITNRYSLAIKDVYGYTSSGGTGALAISPTYRALYSAGSSSATFTGMNFNVVTSDSLAPNEITGINVAVNHGTNDPVASLDNIATVSGAKFTVSNTGGGVITNAYGLQLGVSDGGGSGTISNAYGLYFQAPTGTMNTYYGARFLGASDTNISTVYLLRLGQTDRSGTIYNLYADGTAPNYFNGDVSIGRSVASSKLDVDGDARFRGIVRDASGDAGSSGQVLSSTTTGTNWVDAGGSVSAGQAMNIASEEINLGAANGIYNDGIFTNSRQVNLDGYDLKLIDTVTTTKSGPSSLMISTTHSDFNNGGIGRLHVKVDPTLRQSISLAPTTVSNGNAVRVAGIDGWSSSVFAGTRKASMDFYGYGNRSSIGFSTNDGDSNPQTDVLVIRYDGNVGIGTGDVESPTQKLDVNGDVRIREHIFDENNSVGTPGQVLSTTATGIDWVDASGGATSLVALSDVGTVGYTSGHVLIADGTDYDSRALVEADISDFGSYNDSIRVQADAGDDIWLTPSNRSFSIIGFGEGIRTVIAGNALDIIFDPDEYTLRDTLDATDDQIIFGEGGVSGAGTERVISVQNLFGGATNKTTPSNAATVDLDANSMMKGKWQINCSSVTTGITLTFSNFKDGSDYLVYFTNVSGTITITLPSNEVINLQGDGSYLTSWSLSENEGFYLTFDGTDVYVQ